MWPSVKIAMKILESAMFVYWTLGGNRMFGRAQGLREFNRRTFVVAFVLKASGADAFQSHSIDKVVMNSMLSKALCRSSISRYCPSVAATLRETLGSYNDFMSKDLLLSTRC